MSDDEQLRHKSSLETVKEIQNDIETLGFVKPVLLGGGRFDSQWIDNAFREAQENVDRLHGRLPSKVEKQPNPAVSLAKTKWQSTTGMNNSRELGSGDVKKGS